MVFNVRIRKVEHTSEPQVPGDHIIEVFIMQPPTAPDQWAFRGMFYLRHEEARLFMTLAQSHPTYKLFQEVNDFIEFTIGPPD